MKRVLSIILAGLMLLSLAACGAKEEPADFRRGIIEQGNVAAQLRLHNAEYHANNKQKDPDSAPQIYDNLTTALNKK